MISYIKDRKSPSPIDERVAILTQSSALNSFFDIPMIENMAKKAINKVINQSE